jgi:hypothetical protein
MNCEFHFGALSAPYRFSHTNPLIHKSAHCVMIQQGGFSPLYSYHSAKHGNGLKPVVEGSGESCLHH